jgi:hypothetical protein
MEESDVKIMSREMSERNVDIEHIPGIMEYLIPKKKIDFYLVHREHGKPEIKQYMFDDFISKHQTYKFLMTSNDNLKFYLQFNDDEKMIRHCFVIPKTRIKRETWIHSFQSKIDAYPSISNEIEPFFFKIGWDESAASHHFMVAAPLVRNDYELSISYKITREWVDFFQKMIQVLNIIQSFEAS